LIEENQQIKMKRDEMTSQNQKLLARIISLQKENLNLNNQISSLKVQNQQLIGKMKFKEDQNNEEQSTISELSSTFSKLKSSLDSYPIAPFLKFEKNDQCKPILFKSLLWSYNRDLVQHFRQKMVFLNQKIAQQFNKSFSFELPVEQTKIHQNFPLQPDLHEGLFSHLTSSYSLAQLSEIILIETSSDSSPLDYPKENVLFWGSPAWWSENLPNSSISFALLSGEFSIEGYRICGDLQFQPINFKLEGKIKDGEWAEIDGRNNELNKAKFQNSLFSETSFECKKKGTFQSFRLTNLSPITNGYQWLNLCSITFFGKFI
jgi:hypothetical protein